MLIAVVNVALGASPWFIIYPTGVQGYCGETEQTTEAFNFIPTYVAGARGELRLSVPATNKPGYDTYLGVPNSLPQGLTIEAGYWDSTAKSCQWDQTLRDQLQFRHLRGPDLKGNFVFSFGIPQDMSEQLLCVSVTWNGSPWGDLSSVPQITGYNEFQGHISKPRPLVIRAMPPCTDLDRKRAAESHILEYWVISDWTRTLTLADSIIALGWQTSFTYRSAVMAAEELGQYTRALQYLDQCYQQFGWITQGDTGSQTQQYERKRKALLDRQQKSANPK